jgi:hypothetical protein
MIRCQKCGYTNQSTAKKCIKCNSPLTVEAGSRPAGAGGEGKTSNDIKFESAPWDKADTSKTIRRGATPVKKACSLVQLSEEGDEEIKIIPVKGELVNLNRDFLDEGNTSISRKAHATLTFKDGEWWVNNETDKKTTFVQVNKPVKLSDGDVILLGDTMFRFTQK